MLISFIVPVYNVYKYVRRCVESLTAQTYSDIEVILVDDGSTDGSSGLCDRLSEEDCRIRVIHKENGGLSDARNTGLRDARGEYVVFVDSDDFWPYEGSLSQLVEIVSKENTIDFLGFNCMYYYEQSDEYRKWRMYSEKIVENSNNEYVLTELIASGTIPMSACLKLMKREFLLNNELFFQKGIVAEDIPWFISMIIKADKVRFVNDYVYAYRQNVVGSISNSFSLRTFNDLFGIIRNQVICIPTYDVSQETKDALYSFMAYEFCILLSNIVALPDSLRGKKREELMEYKWLLNYTSNPKVKLTRLICRLCGIRITEKILAFYQKNH